nr:hypothetical protein [Tanacetum cinerariifolium]
KILEALTVDGMRKKSITRFRACLMKWTKPGAGARAGAKILEALTVDELQKKSITRFRACLTKWAELGAGAEARAEAGAGAGAQLRLGLGLRTRHAGKLVTELRPLKSELSKTTLRANTVFLANITESLRNAVGYEYDISALNGWTK